MLTCNYVFGNRTLEMEKGNAIIEEIVRRLEMCKCTIAEAKFLLDSAKEELDNTII